MADEDDGFLEGISPSLHLMPIEEFRERERDRLRIEDRLADGDFEDDESDIDSFGPDEEFWEDEDIDRP